MDKKQLITINQNSKQVLIKSKNLLDITKKILEKKDLIENFEFKPFLMEKGHSSYINSVSISSDNKYIVSGSKDKTIKIWDMQTDENIYTIDNTYDIAIDNNGYFIGSDKNIDKCLRVSELPLTQRKLTLEEINHFRKRNDFF